MSFLIGLLAGLFGGLVGLGGGVVMIPLLVALRGIGQHRAHGTSLVALVFTGLAGAATYARGGAVDAGAALLLAATAVFTARSGARYAHALAEWKLRRSFGAFMIGVALLMYVKPHLPRMALAASAPMRAGTLLVAGAGTGFLSGMMGVGGGSLMVPAMVLLAGFPQQLAQGSSLLAMVPAGAVGAATHWRLGNVATHLLPGLVPGVLAGTVCGGLLAQRLSEPALRSVFAAVLVWTGVRYLGTRAPA